MKILKSWLAIASLSLCGIGLAGSLNTTMSVGATVISGCNLLSATSLNFGSFPLP